MAVGFWYWLDVINPQGELVATMKHGEDAACLVAFYGDGAKIRRHGSNVILWHEGHEEFPAAESYDGVCSVITRRHVGTILLQELPELRSWR